MEFHKIFKAEAEKMADKVKEQHVSDCLWKETHEMMQDWYTSIKGKIDKY